MRKTYIDPSGVTRYDRRQERINDQRIDRVYQAYRLLVAYANPLRHGMVLSGTEQVAVQRAAELLRVA